MPEKTFQIRVRRGHVRRLRFGFCPVNEKIMNADADWPENEELCCDTICTRELFFPFIEKYYKGKFKFRNELNVMPFGDVAAMSAEVRRVQKMLKDNYSDPYLDQYKKNFAIDLLVDGDEYDQKYLEASDAEKEKGVEEHVDVICTFYGKICDYLEDEVKRLSPKGFNAMAIWAPH